MRLLKAPEMGIAGVLLLVVVVFTAINPAFLTPGNLAVLLRASAFTGIVAVGMGFLLMSGMIDISVGAVASLASIVTSWLIVKALWPIWVSIGIGLLVGLSCGLLNSLIVLKLKVPAFLATIGAMYVYRGLSLVLSNGYTIYPLPDAIASFSNAQPFGLSWPVIIFLSFIVIGELVLRFTVWGLTVKATGSDREIARWTEVDVDRVNMQTFMVCGTCAAAAGLLLTGRVLAGTPTLGEGWELQSITAAAIGGVSLFGYDGSMVGVLLGVLLIQTINNGLVVVGASAYLQWVEVGILLVATAVFDYRRKSKLQIIEESSK